MPDRPIAHPIDREDGDEAASPRSPFGARLTQIVSNTVQRSAQDAIARGRPISDFTEHLSKVDWIHLFEDAAEPINEALAGGLPDLVDFLQSQEQQLVAQLAEVWGAPDAFYRAANYIAYELGSSIANARSHHGGKILALLGAHGRAIKTAGEIRHLAMGGFANGATARWRSLHDLAVVSVVLSEADDDIAERYLAYSRIETAKDIREHQKHALKLGQTPFSDQHCAEAEQAADAVVAEWGTMMRRPNGWAAPLFPNASKIDFVNLEDYAGLGHLRPFYRLGNHYVHAGARAAELNSRAVGPERFVISTGPTVSGDIAETCHGAMISLHQAMAALVGAFIAEDRESWVDLVVGVQAQSRLVDRAGSNYGAAAEVARSRGWFSHRADDD